jgi:FAD/FMN-containing dehydrogenase
LGRRCCERMELKSKKVRSWGRVSNFDHEVADVLNRADASEVFDAVKGLNTSVLAYGLGRSYGDSNLNENFALADMRKLDRFISFDQEHGILRAEAGVSLSEILKIVVPNGFFLHTTPGTRFVTLGGAVANDVHGKNHHGAGAFGENVRAIGLARSDRSDLILTRTVEPELFAATIGGLGLTGIILWVEIELVRIPSSQLSLTTIPFANVEEFFDLSNSHFLDFEHTVAWVDCAAKGADLGRGIFTGGNWSTQGGYATHTDGGPRIPVDAPEFALNPITLNTFNSLYHWRQKTKQAHYASHYTGCFYPLDAIQAWNRLYGPHGFFQYQSVVPLNVAAEATREMLKVISRSGDGSLLAVLKTFGDKPGRGLLSFPEPGATLALDFRNRGKKTLDLMAELDVVVAEAGGRLYPAKDGRLPSKMFREGYPEWERVEALRDPYISSSFWRRVTSL